MTTRKVSTTESHDNCGQIGKLNGPKSPPAHHQIPNRAITAFNRAPVPADRYLPLLQRTNGKPNETNAVTRQRSQVVLDMLYLTLNDTSSVRAGKAVDGPSIPEASRAMIRALRRAQRISPLDVEINQALGSANGPTIRQALKVSVERKERPDAAKEFAVFTIRILGSGSKEVITAITVKFGRDHATRPKRWWIGIQANPTSLLTGQNIWPLEPLTSSQPRGLATIMGWPFVVLTAICEAADRKFSWPTELLNAAMKGAATVQNAQFAIYLSIPNDNLQPVLALLAAAFETRRFGFVDGQHWTFAIGELLRITAKTDTSEGRGRYNAPARFETVRLRKKSGTHDLASLSFYDKALQMRLSDPQARAHGLTDRLRVDITLQGRGLEKLLNAAKRLAAQHKVDTEVVCAKGKLPLRTVSNLIAAMTMIDGLYALTTRDTSDPGFEAWLRSEILNGEFHLNELFGASNQKWDALCEMFEKSALTDPQYGKAFAAWRSGKFNGPSLRHCMANVGISRTSVDRQLVKARVLGFSGDVPPYYWLNRDALTITWGSTDKELKKFCRQAKRGDSVSDHIKRNAQRMKRVSDVIAHALVEPSGQLGMVRAPIVEELTWSDPIFRIPLDCAVPPLEVIGRKLARTLERQSLDTLL